MNVLRFLRSHLNAVYALGAIAIGALALAAAPAGAMGAVPAFELLLFGWLGVALGRTTIGRDSRESAVEGQARPNQETTVREETIERVLRQVAKVLQTHLADSETYSTRLNGASKRLLQLQSGGPINEIVLALLDDNREMRDKLCNVRNQLEESRIQVVKLQSNLERAEEVGMQDVVTAIGNRRFFEAAFAEEMERARSTGDDFCLALADIDRFKLVNDRFGHLVGDRLLRLFAEILVKNVRGQDKVARFGGEEFAMMFPGARLVDAVAAAERIRKVLESKQWTVEPSGERVGKVTASFGVARLRANETANDFLQRVDERLYEAKAEGRNRVIADDADYGASPSTGRARGRRAAAG
jgi:diguanylate cyclase